VAQGLVTSGLLPTNHPRVATTTAPFVKSFVTKQWM
jgi:hypothetical protein